DPDDDGTAEDGVEDDGTANDNSEQGSTQESGTNLQDRYNFVEFNLDADIDNENDALEIDFEVDQNETEAKYIERSRDIEFRGDEAIEELDSIFMSFRFDADSTDDEILDEVFEAFNIPDTATDVDLDIEFSNGNEREIER